MLMQVMRLQFHFFIAFCVFVVRLYLAFKFNIYLIVRGLL